MTLAYLVLILTAGCSLVDAPMLAEETPQMVVASGTIQADAVHIASELGGRIQNVVVAEGDAVTAGDVLVTLDATPWQLQLGPAEANLAHAQAELEVLLAQPRAEEVAAAEAALNLAQARADGAEAAWQNAQDVLEHPQELDSRIAEAKTQVALAEQAVELAEAQLAQVQLLRDQKRKGTVEREAADYQVAAAEAELAAAQADLSTAQTLLDRLWWIRSEPLGYIAQANAAEGQVHVAEAGVAVAQAQLGDAKAGATPEEIALAQAAVRQAEAEIALLRLKVDRCTLQSPIDGIVIGQALQVGELAAPAATILKLTDLSEVTLEVYVPEDQIGRVAMAQSVAVTTDSFPDRTFTGTVRRIGDQPEYTPRNVATTEERRNTFYAVEIRLANEDGALKPGMPADAQF